jgi:UbiD family decarboxylase
VKDIRQWIRQLETAAAGELIRVKKQIDPARFEATALMEQIESRGRFEALLFEKPRPFDGQERKFRLLMNTFGTVAKMASALGLPPDKTSRTELMETILEKQGRELDYTVVRTEDAPVKEVTLTGADVDLRMLPLVRHVDMDGDCYFTPIVVAKDKKRGRYNVSWNRMMYLDHQHLGIYMSPRHLWSYFMESEANDQSLPIGVVLGHHPAFHMTGALLTPLNRDEYRVAGSFLGESLRVTPSITYGDDLYIPADAEIVIEGEIVAGQRTIEGPFGEFTGYSGPQRISWLFQARAINFRRDGIIISIFPCKTEHLNAHFPIEASVFRVAKEAVPNVIDTNWVHSGGPLSIIIRMKKMVEGEPMRAAMAAFSASNFIKIVIVVDEDIDPTDLKEVMWAVSTRVQPEVDLQVLTNLQGQVLDPSLRQEIRGSGMVIDATKPLNRPFPRKGEVPASVMDKIKLDDYVTKPGS